MQTTHLAPLKNPFSYSEYKDLVIHLANNKACTGDLTEPHIEATHINAQRMKRIDKQCVIDEDLSSLLKSLHGNFNWILLVESWCGDGAQCAPVIAKMAELNPNIRLQLILRDDNLQIMDAHLTNGSRSIPKLLILKEGEVIDTWGARPKAIQQKVIDFKKENPGVSHEEFVTNLHLWYAQDKTHSIQEDFKEMLSKHI